MAIDNTVDVKLEKHLFLSQIAEEIGRYGSTDKKCPVCGGEFILRRKGNSYILRCETDNCMKISSRGI